MGKYLKWKRGVYPQWYRINRVEEGELLGHLRREYVRCGKPNCRCKAGEKLHGPYAYRYWRDEEGRRRKEYVRAEEVDKVREAICRRLDRLRRERKERNEHMRRGQGNGMSAHKWKQFYRVGLSSNQ